MTAGTNNLIGRLGAELRPVRRLAPPAFRIGVWVAATLVFGVLLAMQADGPAVVRHLESAPDLWLAVVGSVATAVTAAVATFLVSLPDRSPYWAWLPVPPLAVWIGASGMGCLRGPMPGMQRVGATIAGDLCLPFILATALPLTALLLLLLRPVATIRPERTTLMGGLAVAATAASLLWLDHPYDAGLADLGVHLVAIMMVVGLLRLAGAGVLRRLSPGR